MVLPKKILQAALKNDTAAIRDWFSTGTRDPDEKEGKGRTLLHAAAYEGHCDVIRELLERRASVDVEEPKSGGSPLHVTIARSHHAAALLLLERGGANINITSMANITPLILAAARGDCDMIRLLLRRGADLDARSRSSHAAEQYARDEGNFEAVALITEIKLAGGWKPYVLFPRKRVLALRVLCEQGRASTQDPLLRRLFPAAPLPLARAFLDAEGSGAALTRAVETALAAQPGANADADALAAAIARSLAAPPPKKKAASLVARDGGRLPRGVFWLIFEFWRCDRDSPY